MTQPYPRAFTYEECVRNCAAAIFDDFSNVKAVASASMAFALSLAFNKSVREVSDDIDAQRKAMA